MADTRERDAVKRYLDDQVMSWFCWLFNVHGVRFDEIHQALVHHREPWISSVIELPLFLCILINIYPVPACSDRHKLAGRRTCLTSSYQEIQR